MESTTDNTPLIVILGPTASGKTALALDLAQRFDGEIIAADSRTVYIGMDIGTAKPTLEEQKLAPHHLIDVVTPDQAFTVAGFQRLARQAIADIASRGKVPILVGGTGLYIDAVIYNFSFRPGGNLAERQQLESLSVDELQALTLQKGLSLPENSQNPRHLIRNLETDGAAPQRSPLRPRTLVLGINPDEETLKVRITARIDAMMKAGFLDEVRRVSSQYGWDAPALAAPGYKALHPFLDGEISLDQAKQQFVQNDWQYAKRQKTWFKRSSDIHWISKSEDAVVLVTTLLNK